MNLPLLDIPDNPHEWPTWLEGQIVGVELGDLVEQLSAILKRQEPGPSLTEICGDRLPQVLKRGLSVLTPDQIRQLLNHPQRLLDLQEQILLDGGDYWLTKTNATESATATVRQWERIRSQVMRSALSPGDKNQTSKPSRRNFLLAAGSITVAGLIGFGLWIAQPTDATPWGWNRPDVFTTKLEGDAYLKHLASAANEWFLQPRDSQADFERQLRAFQKGCDKLLAAPHLQLSKEKKAELDKRCRNWAGKLEVHLADLRQGKPLLQVKQEADETIHKLTAALENGLS